MNSITKRKIDFHLMHCRSASNALEAGIECPKEFQRQSDIRDAAMCAIALEAGIITDIGNAKLTDSQKWQLMGFISGYSSHATFTSTSLSSSVEDLKNLYGSSLTS